VIKVGVGAKVEMGVGEKAGMEVVVAKSQNKTQGHRRDDDRSSTVALSEQ